MVCVVESLLLFLRIQRRKDESCCVLWGVRGVRGVFVARCVCGLLRVCAVGGGRNVGGCAVASEASEGGGMCDVWSSTEGGAAERAAGDDRLATPSSCAAVLYGLGPQYEQT